MSPGLSVPQGNSINDLHAFTFMQDCSMFRVVNKNECENITLAFHLTSSPSQGFQIFRFSFHFGSRKFCLEI